MVKDVLKYYFRIAWSLKKYSVAPVLLSPIGRISVDFISPLLVAQIINKVSTSPRPSLQSLSWLIIGFFVVPVFGEGLWRFIIWSLNRTDAMGMEKIGNEVFQDLMSRSYDFHVNNFAGALVAKAGRFVNAFEPLSDVFVFDIVGLSFSLAFAVIVLLKVSWPVGVAFCIVFVIFMVITYMLTHKRFRYNKIRAEQESILTGQLADSLANAITTKTFAKEEHELKLYSKINSQLTSKRLKAWNYQNIPMDAVTTNTIFIMNTLALLGSLYAVYHYGAKVGTVFLVLTYIRTLTSKFGDFSRIMRNLENNLSNAVEMMKILKDKHTVLDDSDALPLRVTKGDMSLNDVSFSYETKNKEMLFESLNLSIPAGQSVGLIGPSGGGKTTITKLLLRFMDINGGRIEIDGQNISKVTQSSLRDAITYVPQEPLLFHRTLRENIGYGKPGASKKEIVAAAQKAHADEFIDKLPDGYETLVGERGIKLSGGQRQRVALARAILKDAPIIVLDEATSALDSESEVLIQKALLALMDGHTTIVIAHRLSTIKHLDRILVLENGSITEDGSHDELSIKKDGTYARLWAHQSGGFIE
jgi:ATP-binding cassette subfamily B protein